MWHVGGRWGGHVEVIHMVTLSTGTTLPTATATTSCPSCTTRTTDLWMRTGRCMWIRSGRGCQWCSKP
uniref:Putative secreted protein n=1 Tax=Anopheles marajoara TaxID=58244 RepID=A0A2M4CFJ3_9DIPT